MRERAKLYKTQSNKKDFSLSKRLGQEEVKDEDVLGEFNQAEKRKKGADGRPVPVASASRVSSQQNV